METPNRLDDCAAKLVDAARTFQTASMRPGGHTSAPDSLASLEEALQALSGAWYQLAADASPGLWPKAGGLPRELEARLMGALHDVAAAFARCARECRDGRSTIAPIVARSAASSLESQPLPTGRVA